MFRYAAFLAFTKQPTMSSCHRLSLFPSLSQQPFTSDGRRARPTAFSRIRRLSLCFSSASLLPSFYPPFPSSRPLLVCYSSQLHTPVNLQAIDSLPLKLREIVELFEAVPEPRAKYQQLLHYGKKLTPLPKEYQTSENKVEGCVSQVWVKASLGPEDKVYYEAESDSLLTKGLAALLVEGLSGYSPSEILKVSPDFIQMLGLNQSLTPSRSNGFFNMFKLMQKKALQVYMEAEGTSVSQNVGPGGYSDDSAELASTQQTLKFTEVTRESLTTNMSNGASRQEAIRQKLKAALDPFVLEVDDVSYQHAGHAGIQKGTRETHFNVKIVSSKFDGRTLVKRHRMVYDLLQEELHSGLHALSIVAKTPAEIERA